MSKLFGYARVSTSGQSADSQIERLTAEGCAVVRSEKVSGGSRFGRDELSTLLDFIRAGDTLVVVKLDRLGRSTRDVLNIVHELEQRGASLRVLEPAIDTGGVLGKMVLTVLGMVAEMELGFIRDRQKAGIEKAKLKGAYKGRPISLDHNKVLSLIREGIGPSSVARQLNCSRSTVYKILSSNEKM